MGGGREGWGREGGERGMVEREGGWGRRGGKGGEGEGGERTMNLLCH